MSGLVVFFSLFFSLNLFAGGLTQKVEEAYRNTPVLRAYFIQQTFVELLEKEVREEGELLLARPNRFIIHYRGANERKYISDGKSLWIWRKREKETEKIPDLGTALSREALAFLSGLGEMEKEFRVAERGDKLLLFPKASESPFRKILLTIDPTDHLARQIELYPKQGNISRYRLNDLKKEKDVSEKFHP